MKQAYTKNRYFYKVLKDNEVAIESSFVLDTSNEEEASIAVAKTINDIGSEYFNKYSDGSQVQVIVDRQIVELPIKAFRVSDGIYEAIMPIESTKMIQTIVKNIKDNLYISDVIYEMNGEQND